MSDPDSPTTRTSANLTAAGGQSIPNYLSTAFPNKDTSSASSAANTTTPKRRTMSEAFGIIVPDGTFGGIVGGEDSSEEDTSDVPLYVKVRGKGKGRAVMWDRSRSSVAQLHGEFLCPSRSAVTKTRCQKLTD